MSEIIEQLLTYDAWAITRALDSLKSATGGNSKAARLLAHLLVAEQVWYLRLRGEDTSVVNLSPEFSLAECERLAAENHRGYAAYMQELSPAQLESLVTYRNSKGLEFQTSVKEILLHVLLHGAYHRGQLASALRAEGQLPVNTDYITFTRES